MTICGRLGKEKERKKPQAQETRKKFNLNEQNGTLTFFIVLNRSFIKKILRSFLPKIPRNFGKNYF